VSDEVILDDARAICQSYAYEQGVDKPQVDQWTWP